MSYLLITGASRGIGRAIAELALSRGVMVVPIGRPTDELGSLSMLDPDAVHPIIADVRDADAIAAGIAEEIERSGPPAYVILAAGVLGPIDRPWRLDGDELLDAFAVNVVGAANVLSATLPAMREADRGMIVFVSASSASRVFPGWTAYGASKAALDRLMAHTQEENGDRPGITAFSFVPGLTDTRMQERLREVDAERFPMVEQFRRWHERGASKQPSEVAEILERVLMWPPDRLRGQIIEADEVLKEERRAARQADA